MELLVSERELVVPGTLLAVGDCKNGGGIVKEGDSFFSTVLGLFYYNEGKNLARVVPLEGKYLPKEGDSVVGKIYKVLPGKWLVDINPAYIASLDPRNALHDRVDDLSRIYSEGDLVFAKVDTVNEIYDATLFTKSMPYGRLRGGTIVEIRPTRVPRLIGKKGSMIYMIKQETKAKILVGQNGLVWIKGRKEMEELIVRVIKMIDTEAHISGLTDKTKEFLKAEKEKLKITGDN